MVHLAILSAALDRKREDRKSSSNGEQTDALIQPFVSSMSLRQVDVNRLFGQPPRAEGTERADQKTI